MVHHKTGRSMRLDNDEYDGNRIWFNGETRDLYKLAEKCNG